jgi:hypothetical protein
MLKLLSYAGQYMFSVDLESKGEIYARLKLTILFLETEDSGSCILLASVIWNKDPSIEVHDSPSDRRAHSSPFFDGQE